MQDWDRETLEERANELSTWIARRERRVRSRGWDLLRRGRVLSCSSIRKNQIVGTVSGSAMYSVLLSYEGRTWSGTCSCPYKFDCKHAVALAEKWLETFIDDTPVATPSRSRSPAPAVAKRPKRRTEADGLLDSWRAQIEAGLGRPMEPGDEKTVRDFAELFGTYQGDGQCLRVEALRRWGFGDAAPRGASHLDAVFSEQMEECPPETALELLPFIAAGYRLNGAELPPPLRPITDAARVDSLHATLLEEQQLAAWERVANQDASQPNHSFVAAPPPKLHGFRARLTPSGSAILERRTGSDAAWKVETQDSITQLSLATPADLPQLPTADLALAMTIMAFVRQGPAYYSRSGGMAPVLLEKLLASPLTRAACVMPDGSPVEVETSKLVLEAEFTDETAQQLALRLKTEDGRDAAAAQRLATVSNWFCSREEFAPVLRRHRPTSCPFAHSSSGMSAGF